MNRQELIIQSVAEAYKITALELNADTRKQPFKEARQMAMYIIHKDDLSLTWKYVGECFNPVRDHATVMHAVKTIQNLLDTEVSMQLRFEKCMGLIISKPEMPSDEVITARLRELNKWLNDPENADHKCRREVQIEYNVYNKLFIDDAIKN